MKRSFCRIMAIFIILGKVSAGDGLFRSLCFPEDQAVQEKEKISALLQRLDRFLEKQEMDAVTAQFLRSGEVIGVGLSSDEKSLGWESLARLLRTQRETVKNLKIKEKDLTIHIDPSATSARYMRTLDITFVSNYMPFAVSNARETGVLIKIGEEWRIVQQHTSAPITGQIWAAYLDSTSAAGKGDPLKQLFQPELLRQDFDLLRQALEEAHAGFYRYTEKESFNALFAEKNGEIDRAMTEIDFFRLISPLFESIHCVHTAISPSAALWKRMTEQGSFLPLDLAFLQNKGYLIRRLDENIPIPLGSEIVSINDRPLSDIITILLKAIPADGLNFTYKYRILDRDFPEKYALHIEQPEKFQVDYRPAKNGDIRTASLSAAPYRIINEARPSFEDFYRECLGLKFYEREKAAALTIKTFVPRIIKQFGFDFSKFLESSFSTLKERGTEHLVLDLRDNDGGDSKYLTELLSHLLDRPFRLLERVETPRVRYSFLEYTDKGLFFNHIHPHLWERDSDGWYRLRGNWKKTYDPKPEHFPGKIYVLINGMSISASADAAALLHFHKRAVFIGEETGGAYAGNNSGDFLNLTLPHTGVRARIPIRSSSLAVSGYNHPGRGVMPEYPLEPTIEEMLRGHDPAISFALELVRGALADAYH